MTSYIRLLFLFSLTACIVSQGALSVENLKVESNSMISHLKEYAHTNEPHHDNIADIEHSHSHKHSEDGEEHEHHHEHISSLQPSLKLMNVSVLKMISNSFRESDQNFIFKVMISSEHPFPIFRPPIA